MSDTALPVASLIAIETRLVSGEHRSKLGESRGRVMPERFINPGRLRNALGLDQVEAAQDRRRFELVDRGRRQQHHRTVILVCAFEPRGEVHIAADGRVLHPLCRADRAGQHLAGRETDAHLDRLEPALGSLRVQRGEGADHIIRDIERVVGIGGADDRRSEDRHQPVAHIFVEHAAAGKDDLDHLGKVFVQHRHRIARGHGLGHQREAPDVRKQHGGDQVAALEDIVAAREQPIDDLLCHIARHRVAHALFTRDVLEHQHVADRIPGSVEERRRRQVDGRDTAVRQPQVGVGVVVGGSHLRDKVEASRDPRVEIAESVLGGASDQRLRRQPENALCRLVDLHDDALPIERDDAVRQRLQDVLIVVLQCQYIGKQPGIFERDRDARGKGLQPADIHLSERPATLVEHLDDAEALAGPVDDRDVEQIAGAKAGGPIDFRVEARIGIGVGDVEQVAAGECRAGDPRGRGYADLFLLGALGHLGPEFVLGRVIDEERRALGVEQLGRRRHDAGEQGIDVQLGRDRFGDLQELQLFATGLLEPLLHLRLLEGTRGMTADRLQERHVDGGKRARALVQHLGDADDLVRAVAQRDAQYAAGAKSGASVDLRVEARVAISVVDNLGDTRAKYRAGDADVLRDPDLRHALAVGLP